MPLESIILSPGWVDFIMLRHTWNPESNWAGAQLFSHNRAKRLIHTEYLQRSWEQAGFEPALTGISRNATRLASLFHGCCTGGAAHDSIYDGSSISYLRSNTRLFTSPRRPIRKGRYCQLTIICHTLCATHTAWWVLWDSNPGLLLYESSVLTN